MDHEPNDLGTCAQSPPLNEAFDICMAVHTAEETALRGIFPEDDIELFRVVEDEFVIGLGRKGSVEVACHGLHY